MYFTIKAFLGFKRTELFQIPEENVGKTSLSYAFLQKATVFSPIVEGRTVLDFLPTASIPRIQPTCFPT